MNSKQKNSALILGFVLVLFCAYRFSIQKTIASGRLLQSLEKESVLLAGAGDRIFRLQQGNKYLDSILDRHHVVVEGSFQQTLLQKVHVFCKDKKITIVSFNEPHVFTSGGSNVFTYSFTLRGSFADLLAFTHYLERQGLGEVVTVNFEKKKNYKTRRDYLTCGLLLQKLSE